MKVAVITPTTGHPYLEEALSSVAAQTVPVSHYVFVDGEQYHNRAKAILDRFSGLRTTYLADNTGADGYYGHRIYAAASHLVDADVYFLLDEDNFYDKDHVEKLLSFMDKNKLDWAYSLRKLVDAHSKFLSNDDCDSLGFWGNFCDFRPGFVDTNCYAVSSKVFRKLGHLWDIKVYTADMYFYQACSQINPSFGCNAQYTSNYRLHKDVMDRYDSWFCIGNINARTLNPDGFPWQKEKVYEPSV